MSAHATQSCGYNTCRHSRSDAVLILGTRLLPTTQPCHGVNARHCNTSVAVCVGQHRRCRRHDHRPAKHPTVLDIATVTTQRRNGSPGCRACRCLVRRTQRNKPHRFRQSHSCTDSDGRHGSWEWWSWWCRRQGCERDGVALCDHTAPRRTAVTCSGCTHDSRTMRRTVKASSAAAALRTMSVRSIL